MVAFAAAAFFVMAFPVVAFAAAVAHSIMTLAIVVRAFAFRPLGEDSERMILPVATRPAQKIGDPLQLIQQLLCGIFALLSHSDTFLSRYNTVPYYILPFFLSNCQGAGAEALLPVLYTNATKNATDGAL
jgi:hypothetical protein